MSNEVVVPDHLKKYMTPAAASDASSMASASITVPRISLKGKKFQFLNGDDESKKTDTIEVVILGVDPEGPKMIKTFYKNGYNPNDTAPPDCSSSNGESPDSWVNDPVSPRCSSCPKNVFGSATSPTGKKTKACRDAKRLWVAKVEEIDGVVYGLNVPVTSLKDMAEYGKEIRNAGVPLSVIVTQISMDEDSEFPKIHFQRLGFLNEESSDLAMSRNASRDWMAGLDLRNALPAPSNSDAPKLGATAANLAGDDAITTVDPDKVNEIAKNW